MSDERLHDLDRGLEPWQIRLRCAGVPKAAWSLNRETIIRTPENTELLEALLRYHDEKLYEQGKGISVIAEEESDATLLLSVMMKALIRKFPAMVMMETFHEGVCLDYSEVLALAIQTAGDHFIFQNIAEARFLFLDSIDDSAPHPAVKAALRHRVKQDRVTFLHFLGSSVEGLGETESIYRMFHRLNETFILG